MGGDLNCFRDIKNFMIEVGEDGVVGHAPEGPLGI